MIKLIVIKGYRQFVSFELAPNPGMNIIVGDNEAGKSTLLEAIALALTCHANGHWAQEELDPYWFNQSLVQAYFKSLSEPAEVRFLPCSEQCANWLRYGVQPKGAGPGLRPGWCASKAHDRENLGLGGRRVLVSRQWSGKTLREHRADRATVVREALLNAGLLAPEVERLAASVTLPDGRPRFVWTDTRPDPASYARVVLESVAERARWRAQYEAAKQGGDARSATSADPDG